MIRDPRLDPRPGDVFRGNLHESHRYERTVTEVGTWNGKPWISYLVLGLGGLRGQPIADFIAWAQNAEVIHAAD